MGNPCKNKFLAVQNKLSVVGESLLLSFSEGDNMDFNKLILGERELRDFENLLLRSKMIDAVQDDFQGLTNMREEYASALKQRINSKKKLLIF